MRNVLACGVLVLATGCSGSVVELGGYTGDAGGGSADGAPATSPDGAIGTSTAKVEIRLRASTATVPHTDGLSGQTPADQKIGVRSLTLAKSADDPAPLLVFDLGENAVEAGLNDKDDTLIATVPAAPLKAGRYTIARVGISHVRYRVAAQMHALAQNVAGEFDNVQVLSDGSVVDGKAHDKGYFSYTFTVGGQSIATKTGESGPLPGSPSAGGITLDTSGATSAYVFPTDIPVDPNLQSDVRIIFELNTHQNFRWEDQAQPEYQTGVFDVTPTTFEPVKSFGANSFRLVSELSRAE